MTGPNVTRLRRILRSLKDASLDQRKIRRTLPVVADREARIEGALERVKDRHSRWKRFRKISDSEEHLRDAGSLTAKD